MITYPRTDSRYLPEDYTGNVRETMQDIGNSDLDVAKYAKAVLAGSDENGPRLHKSRRVFDSKKVSDHFAIIPTGKIAKLSETEQKLYDMIVKRFIAVFYPSAEFEQTTRLTRIEQDTLQDRRPHPRQTRLARSLWPPPRRRLRQGRTRPRHRRRNRQRRSRRSPRTRKPSRPPASPSPPCSPRWKAPANSSTTKRSREAMAERGLGTPATRAATIEGLIAQKYLARDGRELHVTGSGMRLIQLVREMDIEGLYSPQTHRRLGIQTPPDGARPAQARAIS